VPPHVHPHIQPSGTRHRDGAGLITGIGTIIRNRRVITIGTIIVVVVVIVVLFVGVIVIVVLLIAVVILAAVGLPLLLFFAHSERKW
jgi:hypothetical protein